MKSPNPATETFCDQSVGRKCLDKLLHGLRETVEEPESQSEDEPGQEARGSGWKGQVRPMMIGRGTKAREMHDGASLCLAMSGRATSHWFRETAKASESNRKEDVKVVGLGV